MKLSLGNQGPSGDRYESANWAAVAAAGPLPLALCRGLGGLGEGAAAGPRGRAARGSLLRLSVWAWPMRGPAVVAGPLKPGPAY